MSFFGTLAQSKVRASSCGVAGAGVSCRPQAKASLPMISSGE